ncbi:G1/S-specific cyclin-E2 [Sciurus carolinensis]|uniref:G1/S-specific cyclin-E2 n=1 Tax=Sciurus carolinensis TaxID=30640 RepID=A0AA41N8Q1_SCICA|nr:G1/S-specific cyclin-E2 [Sciurus carolinensis]
MPPQIPGPQPEVLSGGRGTAVPEAARADAQRCIFQVPPLLFTLPQMPEVSTVPLNWRCYHWAHCHPPEVSSWGTVAPDVAASVDTLKDAPKVLPQYSQETFIQVAQCILAIDSLEFQYRVPAAASLCHFTSIEVVKKASGLEWDIIPECVDWMVPFVSVVKSTNPVTLKTFKKIPVEDRHTIQTHTNYFTMLDELNYVNAFRKGGQLSPVCNGDIRTPPKSTEKHQENTKGVNLANKLELSKYC